MSAERRTFYVTTPIYYVTAKPHLGSLYSTVLADVAARWHQVRGERIFMLTGTDEHGQKVAQAAQAAQQEPRAFVDSFIEAFTDTWKKYNIDYSSFIRTTDPAHIKAVQQWVQSLQQQGDIYRALYEGYYCTPCETFVLERNEDGSAPSCPSCGRSTALIAEPCYFFRLSAYQEKLLAWYDAHPHFVLPTERMNEVRAFVERGLKDLAISRSKTAVSWGIPFPGDESQVVYVWADALNNYISAVGYGDPARAAEFATWWPAQLQVLGKDIIRFHAIYWPAFLMAAGLPLPEKLLVHGWIKVGDQKMSKSLGNVVDPLVLLERYGADAVRYYLVRYLAVTHDAPFTLEDFETRTNADLADSLGNLVQRLTSLAAARGFTQLVVPATVRPAEEQLYKELAEVIKDCTVEMESYLFHRAYAHLWRGIAALNSYVHAQQPWKLKPEEQEQWELIVGTALYAVAALGLLIWPVMPTKIEQLFAALGTTWDQVQKQVVDHRVIGMPRGAGVQLRIQKQQPLFPKVEPSLRSSFEVPLPKHSASSFAKASEDRPAGEQPLPAEQVPVVAQQLQEPVITIDEFNKVVLRVGTVTQVQEVPKSDKLYQLTIDAGSAGVRTICSGVRSHFAPDELRGKQVIFVANLAPRKMMGIPSEGMVLFAEDEAGKLQLVTPEQAVPNGTRLR